MKKFILTIMLLVLLPFTAWGTFIGWPLFQAFDENGDPLVGGLVNTYNCGGVVAKTTYSDAAMTVPNANPVVLNARGEANIYAAGCTNLVITTALGVAVEDTDYYGGNVAIIQDTDGNTMIQVEESTDEDIIRLDIDGTEQMTWGDGYQAPTTTDDIALGTNLLRWKDIHTNRISGHPFPGFLMRPKFTYVESLDYDGGTVLFVVGETVNGAGAAAGVVVALSVGATATTGTLYINTRNATAYVNDEVLTGSTAGAAVANQASSKNAVVISPFVYYHAGTTEQLLYSDSNLAYEFTSLGTSDWSYLYFDDSDIMTAATNLVTAAYLIDSVTEPEYVAAKHGWHHPTTVTNDKCFFAVLTDGSNNILEFFHDGDAVYYGNNTHDVTIQDIDAPFVTIEAALTMPIFARRAIVNVRGNYGDTATGLWWRTTGSNATTGHYILYMDADVTSVLNTLTVITDSAHKIDLSTATANINTVTIDTSGWKFPNGM